MATMKELNGRGQPMRGQRHEVMLYYTPFPWSEQEEHKGREYTFLCYGAGTSHGNYVVDCVMHEPLPGADAFGGRAELHSFKQMQNLLRDRLMILTDRRVTRITRDRFTEITKE